MELRLNINNRITDSKVSRNQERLVIGAISNYIDMACAGDIDATDTDVEQLQDILEDIRKDYENATDSIRWFFE